ncbi:MAG: recombination protein RecR [Spirochaetes bacterium GWF1_51_8]|nr:MAG: recombination protein RecR [Spirochaetes bacterium GWF1_51_8]
MLPGNIERFVRDFSRLPGIGRKTSERLSFYILSQPSEFSKELSEAIVRLKEETRLCSQCGNITDSDPCPICNDSSREMNVICVVETAIDIYYIEETGSFKGLYHVLGGLISPLNGVTPDDLELNSLLKRVTGLGIKEVVVALSSTTEGDATALYIREMLESKGVMTTLPARGIPVGTDIQYAGKGSLAQALRNREELK